jgi:hypothetical protein
MNPDKMIAAWRDATADTALRLQPLSARFKAPDSAIKATYSMNSPSH